MISVIVATKNRSKEIISCVRSLLRNQNRSFELIVVDQSTTQKTWRAVNEIRDRRIVYLRHSKNGKSAALNAGIRKARGDIIAFTDDDCLVTSDWLHSIERSFRSYPGVSAIFGRTFPYKPEKHPRETCPCTFTKPTKAIITKPCRHDVYIGFGNNMAARASVFRQTGGFKEWLGPGSIGSNAEDAEFALRLIIRGKRILYNPAVSVYHNRWLTPSEMNRQLRSYTCGEMACYGYFHFQRQSFAAPVIFRNFRDNARKTKNVLKRLVLLEWNSQVIHEVSNVIAETFYQIRGLLVGLTYTLVDPIPAYQIHKRNHKPVT